MIICVCHRVSDREIARHARNGMDFDEIQFELGVGMTCGRCEDCAREVVAKCHAEGASNAASHGAAPVTIPATIPVRPWNRAAVQTAHCSHCL